MIQNCYLNEQGWTDLLIQQRLNLPGIYLKANALQFSSLKWTVSQSFMHYRKHQACYYSSSIQKQLFRIYKSQNEQTEQSLLSYLQLTHLSIYSLCVQVLLVHVLSRNNNRTRVCWSPIYRRPFHASLKVDGELLYQPKPQTSQPS
jgi:hypothetical protein